MEANNFKHRIKALAFLSIGALGGVLIGVIAALIASISSVERRLNYVGDMEHTI